MFYSVLVLLSLYSIVLISLSIRKYVLRGALTSIVCNSKQPNFQFMEVQVGDTSSSLKERFKRLNEKEDEIYILACKIEDASTYSRVTTTGFIITLAIVISVFTIFG